MWSTIIYLVLLCILTAKARKVTSDSACTADINITINRCVSPVKTYAEMLGSTINGGVSNGRINLVTVSTIQGVEMFKELCQKIAIFDVCIKDARFRCPKHILINLIHASYGYLCTEGYNDFMANANCLINLDQDPVVRECHSITVKKIFPLYNSTNLDVDQRLFQLCGALNVFIFCIEDKVKEDCGNLAWSIINKVLKDTTTTLIPTCTFVHPIKADSIKERNQLGNVSKNATNLLHNISRENWRQAQMNPTTLSNDQSTQTNNNLKGGTAPQTKSSATLILSNRCHLNAIICFLFATFVQYK